MEGELASLQVGDVRRMCMPEGVRTDFRHPFWTSGIFKAPVNGPLHVTPDGIDGDRQADLQNHGGPDNVVLAYDADHYPAWRQDLAMPDLAFGGFGENFTVRGFSDETVCIADVWQVGDALRLQVTQARQPCYKLARRLQQPHIVRKVRDNAWGGWYLRVLHDGYAEAGMPIRLIERTRPEWTVVAAIRAMYARAKDPERAAALAAIPELSARWKRELLED